MTLVVDNARAFLRLFQQAKARDMHVRVGDFAMFVARPDGAPNPMRGAVAAPSAVLAAGVAGAQAAAGSGADLLRAPHVASLVSALPVGTAVEVGQALARIELLGEMIDLEAEAAGFVEAVFAAEGELLDYAVPILKLVTTH